MDPFSRKLRKNEIEEKKANLEIIKGMPSEDQNNDTLKSTFKSPEAKRSFKLFESPDYLSNFPVELNIGLGPSYLTNIRPKKYRFKSVQRGVVKKPLDSIQVT